jgi:hypothetical protein
MVGEHAEPDIRPKENSKERSSDGNDSEQFGRNRLTECISTRFGFEHRRDLERARPKLVVKDLRRLS